ncbi:histidine kinase [Chryseolinea sp. T2]|uniref:sensor histidine kinase n=1 Tax=Chryseolinea sp. T2 TaxID=3129255 RepID=UPI0030768E9F
MLLHVVAAVTFIVLPLMFFGPRNDERRMPPPPNSERGFRHPREGHEFPDNRPQPGQMRHQDIKAMQWHSILFNVVLIAFFYLNMYVLVPRILTKKNWLYYAGVILLCFLVLFALNRLIDYALIRDGFRPGRPGYFVTINFLLVFGLSTALRLTSDRIQFEREREQRENENLKSELSLLRSQISPHFMFNVLNSLASLARKKSDQLEPVIIQLSQLMRYMLYDAGDKRMSISKEIEYLSNYIDLQKLRFGNDIDITFETNVMRGDLAIEPMLLIPFVENAFKHGTGLVMNPAIHIDLVSDDQILNFTVRNKFSQATQAKDPSSGIGIQNVRRRLDLLYRDKYMLNLTQDGLWFKVELKLTLK